MHRVFIVVFLLQITGSQVSPSKGSLQWDPSFITSTWHRNETEKTKRGYQLLWKPGPRHSIKQRIIKTRFERKITSPISQQIARDIFQKPSIMEIMKRQFHPWVELGRASAMLASCFLMLGCKHWDTGLRVADTSPQCKVALAIATIRSQSAAWHKVAVLQLKAPSSWMRTGVLCVLHSTYSIFTTLSPSGTHLFSTTPLQALTRVRSSCARFAYV